MSIGMFFLKTVYLFKKKTFYFKNITKFYRKEGKQC